MRLWHKDLITLLPRQQLLGQHRECCALRGKGWGKPHSTVDYVFKHPYAILFCYHLEVMFEMQCRGYKVDSVWFSPAYRGKAMGHDNSEFCFIPAELYTYPEHDNDYYNECINNLKQKLVYI